MKVITVELNNNIGTFKYNYNLSPKNLVTAVKLLGTGKRGSSLKIDGNLLAEDLIDKIEELFETPPSVRKWGDGRRFSATEFCRRYLLRQHNRISLVDLLNQTKKHEAGYYYNDIDFFETLPFSVYSNNKKLDSYELRDIYRKYSAFLWKYICLPPSRIPVKIISRLKEKGISKSCLNRCWGNS